MRITKGFSLIEIVVVMLIIAIIAVSASAFLSASFQSYFVGVRISGLNQEASAAMLRMNKELETAVSFSVINATTVTFTTIDGATITYTLSGSTITRTGTTAQPLAENVTSLAFTYYQSNFTATATPSLVRAITINTTFSNGSELIPLINTIYMPNMR